MRIVPKAALAWLLLAAGAGHSATAAEISVWCPPALRSAMVEIVPRFEQASGHKLAIRWEVMPRMKREIDAGAAFDVAILTADLVDQTIAEGRLDPATRTVIARTGAGLAVRQGAAKPDIASVAGFKRTLLDAKSIGYTSEGASGNAFLAVLERLGIAADIRPKLRAFAGGGATVRPVASGDVDMAVTTIPGILEVPGAELVGPLPAELQTYVEFTAGVGSAAHDAAAARTLIAFLTGPAAAATMAAKGIGLPER